MDIYLAKGSWAVAERDGAGEVKARKCVSRLLVFVDDLQVSNRDVVLVDERNFEVECVGDTEVSGVWDLGLSEDEDRAVCTSAVKLSEQNTN